VQRLPHFVQARDADDFEVHSRYTI
jgi:hypothetical protein